MSESSREDETYSEYVKRYHEEQAREKAWEESLKEITPLEAEQKIDPYGIGGMTAEQIEEFRAWILKADREEQ